MRAQILRVVVIVWLIVPPFPVPGLSNAAPLPTADRPSRPFERQQPSSLVRRPAGQPLAASTPQTITSQAVSTTLIANTDPTTTTQVNAPILTVAVAESSDPVRPGQEFVYTIQYRNDGDTPATGLRITETYPSQVTYVSANPPPSLGNNVWLSDTLDVGGLSRLILVTVRVNTPAANGTLMNNQVEVSSNEIAPFTVSESTQVNAPALQLTKSANPVAPAANSLLTYTLLYTNSGASYASGTIITDAVPASTSYVRCEPLGECGVNGSIVTWPLGQFGPQASGAATLTVLVNNNLPNGTIITNSARITSTEMATASVTLTNTVSSAPNLSLLKSDGVSSAAAGDVLTYQLAYTNTGTAPAQNVIITDRIPANVGFIDCGGACLAMGSDVYSFTLGTVNAAQGGAVRSMALASTRMPALGGFVLPWAESLATRSRRSTSVYRA